MNAVEIKDLKFYYLGAEKPALRIQNFSIEEGETVLITGKSGSGKSTLVQCINGIIPHLMSGTISGEVYIYGKQVSKSKVPEISRVVGTLLQDPERQVINYKIEEEIAFAPENFNLPKEEILERVEKSIEAVGLESLRGRETGKLSGGELQRVALASVLSMDPKILILDEPTSNIDPEGTKKIFEFLAKEKGNRTIIVIEHKVERVLPFVDRVVVIDKGEIIIDGKKDQLIEEAERLVSLGIEIPDHLVLANKMGIKSMDIDEIGEAAYEVGLLPREKMRQIDGEQILKARANVTYGEGFSLSIPVSVKAGTITAIMGRNGAGKSTLLKSLIGFIDKQSANVESTLIIGGKEFANPNLQVRGKFLGYLPQSFDLMLINKTVERELNYSIKVRKLKGMQTLVNDIKERFSLTEYLSSDPLTMSQGQRRRVAMGAILASGVKVIMMDEPTSGQDYFHKQNLGKELTELKELGYAFLIVTHDVRFVDQFADRVLIMDKGQITLEGIPEEVFESSENYGVLPPSEFYLRRRNELLAR